MNRYRPWQRIRGRRLFRLVEVVQGRRAAAARLDPGEGRAHIDAGVRSTLSQDMYDDGYRNIVNTDYSSVVIEQMRRRHEGARPGMQWLEMDVRDLEFEDGSFDVAIDKSTMDAMMSAKGDVWDPPQQVVDDCTAEVDEAIRTLKKTTGIFICLTFGQPHFRRRFLTRPDTTLEVKELGEAFHYYLYVLRT